MSDLTRWAWALWLAGVVFSVSAFSVSAYSNDDCGKLPSHPEYGITRTGTVAGPGTLACAEDMLGAWVYIQDVGWGLCEDTGGAITEGFIDRWVETTERALRFGRMMRNGLVVKGW